METLIRIAKAHARLGLREHTEVDDALVAIALMEESFAARYNHSVFGFE
jgi:DNA replicative helicase MCM subunit Mcm2 (Cdc46/Mcm family)